MKTLVYKYCLFLLFVAYAVNLHAQDHSLYVDSLKKVLATQKDDTNKVNTLNDLSYAWIYNPDSIKSFEYANSALALSKKINFIRGGAKASLNIGLKYFYEVKVSAALQSMNIALNKFISINDKNNVANCYNYIGLVYDNQDNYGEALRNYFTSLKLYEEVGNKKSIVKLKFSIAVTYSNQDDYSEALKRYFDCLRYAENISDSFYIAFCYLGIGEAYSLQNKYSSALTNFSIADSLFKKSGNQFQGVVIKHDVGKVYQGQGDSAKNAGNIKLALQKFTEALNNFNFAKLFFEQQGDSWWGLANVYVNLGSIYIRLDSFPEARNYLHKCIQICKQSGNKYEMRDAYLNLYKLDSLTRNYDSAFFSYKLYILYRDSIYNQQMIQKSLEAKMQYDFDRKEASAKSVQEKKDADAKRIKNQQYFVIATLGIIVLAVVIITIIQFRNNKHKQQTNVALQAEKERVESTLTELKSTQQQLIQSEKMASLGELTAGIAHEIQNPLNFVNNFSEVNKEMLEELKAERLKPNAERDDNLQGELINDLIDNSEKINHHGKRADAIVKGMLQHSRKSSGVKEPTGINALCDEYLRLSYHGFRAKDKNFNADIKTDFDESIVKINIVPQDIGRVLLNLFNNAFYAVNEKAKLTANSYQPTASVKTRKINNKVEVTVSDNGNGIPQNIIDKIFQPFFTTKPTGQGTGLGLSLAYDIITKEHNGTIKVESKEGEGSTFIINLPV